MSEEQSIEQTGVKVVDSAKQMDKNIKNKKLIVGKPKKDKSGTLVYTIKNKTKSSGKLAPVKLGHVFNYLPAGIIDKSETGIGGTSLELDCDRDSIVVQPSVTTAYSKALKLTVLNKYQVRFFGSTANVDTNEKKTIKGRAKKISTKNLKAYLNPEESLQVYYDWAKQNNQPLKIICVTDQLPALKEELNSLKENLFSKFHLVLDEIDSMQEQSSFRNVMEKCMKLFKEHPDDKKTLISATIKHFHDPELSDLKKVKIQYQVLIKKPLTCVISKNICEEVVQMLLTRQIYQKDKVVIACNHIEYCLDIAETLSKNPLFRNKKIKILCSKARSKAVSTFYDSIKDGTLPGDINLITAVYFNAIDIDENYHSIILGHGRKSSLRLSADIMYQITGRCRKKIISNRFIVAPGKDPKYKTYTYEELVEHSDDFAAINELIAKLKKSSNTYFKDLSLEMENILNEGTNNLPSVWYYENGKPIISYLNIDNRLQQQETYEVYKSGHTLLNSLSNRFVVSNEKALYDQNQNQIAKLNPVIRAKELVDKLKQLDRSNDYRTNIKYIKSTLHKKVLPVEKEISEIFEIYLNNETADIASLHKAVDECLTVKQPAVQFKRFLINIKYNYLIASKDSGLDTLLGKYFPDNTEYTKEELDNSVVQFSRVLRKTKPSIKGLSSFVQSLCNSKFAIKKSLLSLESKKTNKARKIIVTGHNPFNIPLS